MYTKAKHLRRGFFFFFLTINFKANLLLLVKLRANTHLHLMNPSIAEKLQKVVLQNRAVPRTKSQSTSNCHTPKLGFHSMNI